ncbi:MAG: glycosyltransferase family 2 protein [Clostridia bacterium]|nr:glycosyltransferase family 2 protein [Clostridia bacterium]
MKYSVIVPIYKTEKYIRECVDSLLCQSYSDIEIILVDDGSPDSCPEIADEYAKRDGRVIVVHKPNGGLVSARKAGGEAATGDYIFNVDSDDFISPFLIEKVDRVIGEAEAEAVFFGFTLYSDDDGEGDRRMSLLSPGVYRDEEIKSIIGSYMYDRDRRGMNGGSVQFNICCKAVRRDLYIAAQNAVKNGVTSGEDTLFTLHLLPKLSSAALIEDYGYYYRSNPTSIEHTVSTRDLDNLLTVITEMEEKVKEIPEYTDGMRVYALYRLWTLSIRGAVAADSLSAFKKHIDTPVYRELVKKIKKAKIYKKRPVENIVLFLTKHRCLRLIYLLGKSYFKNKEMV